jgi:outer membrane protein OmpA-like peptidoglycan-associated protein
MKKTIIIYLFFAFIIAFPQAWSQQTEPSGIKIENQKIIKQQDQVAISFDIELTDQLKIKRNNMLSLTPVLKSNTQYQDSVALPPAAAAGKKRVKALNRKEALGEPFPLASEPLAMVSRKNNSTQTIHYNTTIPYSTWMQDASLTLKHEESGCAECLSLVSEEILVQHIFPEPYQPVYKLTYVVPEVEIKTRSDRHTATFNFVVGRWQLLRDYKDNAPKFKEVEQIVGEIRNNPDLKITEFTIDGYASPEASVPHNRMLAENRANSFADYLVTKFSIDRKLFKVTGHGEDWEGLRKAVDASRLRDKESIIRIIENVSNPDARDAELMKLSAGTTYRTLLNDYYPSLRRTEYVIAYNVRPFNVEEAREIIKTNPKLLSLNEMYQVAQSYPVDSKEFKEVFDIAVRLHPDSEIAIINSTSADIENGNMTAAIERMSKIESNPNVWNNLGVAFAREGKLDKAKEYFTKAASNGDNDATYNLGELNQLGEE